MKINFEIECTPEEARTFFGLPNLQPMQEAVAKEMQERLVAAVRTMDPTEMLKTWMPVGEGFRQWREWFGGQFGKKQG